MRAILRSRLLGVASLSAALAGCGASPEHPPRAGSGFDGGSSGGASFDAGGRDGPPSLDAGDLCGNQIIPAVQSRPNLYFVLDRSGSMADPLPGSIYNKYVNARLALKDLLLAVGHRVQYGAAVFPAPGASPAGCSAGAEVFSTRAGDPPSYAAHGEIGPVLSSLLARLAKYSPDGGTPVSSTLEALAPTLLGLQGDTYVVLATDGAPNCDAQASCATDECMLNLAGTTIGTQQCDASFNCCDPANVQNGQLQCVDGPASIAAVQKLAAAGVKTYVIGMPGSELFSSVLDSLAVAGGEARPGSPRYYPVKNTSDLTDTLRKIGVDVAISCDISLDSAPPDPNLVNLYFDQRLVPSSPTDGWVWTDSTSIQLRGAACDELLSGAVLQVQVVAGCPTTVR